MTIREKAIEQLERISSRLASIGEKEDYTDVAIQALEQTKWIPCSERLPEENEYVLACNSQGTMRVCYYHTDDTFYPTEYADLNETGWYDEVDDTLYFEPIAWMPLPERYKEQTKDEEIDRWKDEDLDR